MKLTGALYRAQVKSDWVGLINEWAGRFFQELDYEREAASAAVFAGQMADLPGITVPDVLPALTSHTVLTSAWVPGVPWGGPWKTPQQVDARVRVVIVAWHAILASHILSTCVDTVRVRVWLHILLM